MGPLVDCIDKLEKLATSELCSNADTRMLELLVVRLRSELAANVPWMGALLVSMFIFWASSESTNIGTFELRNEIVRKCTVGARLSSWCANKGMSVSKFLILSTPVLRFGRVIVILKSIP